MHPMRILHCARMSKYSPFRGLIVWMRVGTGIEQGPTKDGTLLRMIDPKVSIGDIAGFKLCPYEDPRTFRADVRNAQMTLWQNVNLDDRVVRVLRFSRRALCPCASRGSALSLHFSLSLCFSLSLLFSRRALSLRFWRAPGPPRSRFHQWNYRAILGMPHTRFGCIKRLDFADNNERKLCRRATDIRWPLQLQQVAMGRKSCDDSGGSSR